MSQFAFLQPDWPGVFEATGKAGAAVHADPRTAIELVAQSSDSAATQA